MGKVRFTPMSSLVFPLCLIRSITPSAQTTFSILQWPLHQLSGGCWVSFKSSPSHCVLERKYEWKGLFIPLNPLSHREKC